MNMIARESMEKEPQINADERRFNESVSMKWLFEILCFEDMEPHIRDNRVLFDYLSIFEKIYTEERY